MAASSPSARAATDPPALPAQATSRDGLHSACARAIAAGAVSYSSVKSILAENLDRVPLRAPEAVPAPPTHENLRGPDYWAEGGADPAEATAAADSAAGDVAAADVAAGAGA